MPGKTDEIERNRLSLHQFGTLIQTDAKLHAGCSGGALLSLKGELIGLTTSLAALEGVECRWDNDVIDESPAAYKSIDAVMAAQTDLTEPVYVLKQIVVVKG